MTLSQKLKKDLEEIAALLDRAERLTSAHKVETNQDKNWDDFYAYAYGWR